MNRRNFLRSGALVAAGGAALAPSGTSALTGGLIETPAMGFDPAPALATTPESPMRQLYARWRHTQEHANERGISEAEFERRCVVTDRIEEEVNATTFETAEDLALAIMITCPGWWCALSPDNNPVLCLAIEGLAQSACDAEACLGVTA